MDKTELKIERNPESDRLFRCSGADLAEAVLIRVRVLEVPGQAVYVNRADRDVITVQLQSSIALDETGDVETDSDGEHLILSPSRHSFHLDYIVSTGGDFAALLEATIQAEVEKAARKACARAAVVPRLAKLTAASGAG